VNSTAQAELALAAAADAGLQASVAARPAFTSEDFAFMLQARPGAYLWLGQGLSGDEAQVQALSWASRPLHHPCYDFNDRALPLGLRWFTAVVERELPVLP